MTISVYSYIGFGDHCICYGIFKELSKQYDKIYCRSDKLSKRDYENCVRLYASLPKVEVVEEPIITGVTPLNIIIAFTPWWFARMKPWLQDPALPYHCNMPKPDWFTDLLIFDRQRYYNTDVPFYKKWDNFFFERDMKREKEVYYDQLGLNDRDPFLFVQEDPTRKYFLDRKYLNENYQWVESSKFQNISILDLSYTIEKAKEVHVFNSAFLTFIDLMNLQHNNLNYHAYPRDPFWDEPALRLNWKKIK